MAFDPDGNAARLMRLLPTADVAFRPSTEPLFAFWFSDMGDTCLPDDLFSEFAASDATDDSVPQTQRVFVLMLMMRQDGMQPASETYRSVAVRSPSRRPCLREGDPTQREVDVAPGDRKTLAPRAS